MQLQRSEESLSNIKQYYVWCHGEKDKFKALSNLYGVLTIGQCIVFCHVSHWIGYTVEPLFCGHVETGHYEYLGVLILERVFLH